MVSNGEYWSKEVNIEHIPSGRLGVGPRKLPIFCGFADLSTPMTGRVKLLIDWRETNKKCDSTNIHVDSANKNDRKFMVT